MSLLLTTHTLGENLVIHPLTITAAAWTNLWRMYYAYDGSMHTITRKMHEKYGPVVRMGPNYLDLDYAACAGLIKTCFDTKGVWKKASLLSLPPLLRNEK